MLSKFNTVESKDKKKIKFNESESSATASESAAATAAKVVNTVKPSCYGRAVYNVETIETSTSKHD